MHLFSIWLDYVVHAFCLLPWHNLPPEPPVRQSLAAERRRNQERESARRMKARLDPRRGIH